MDNSIFSSILAGATLYGVHITDTGIHIEAARLLDREGLTDKVVRQKAELARLNKTLTTRQAKIDELKSSNDELLGSFYKLSDSLTATNLRNEELENALASVSSAFSAVQELVGRLTAEKADLVHDTVGMICGADRPV